MSEEGKKAEEVKPERVLVPVPFELSAIGPEEVGKLLGCQPRTVLEIYACRPDFPERIQRKPARWIAGEILVWRNERMRKAA